MLIKFLQLTKILSSPSVNKLHQNWWNIEISSYFLLLIKPLLCYVQGLPYASLGCCQERMSYDALIEKTTKKVQRTWSCADTKKTIDLLELKKYQLKSIRWEINSYSLHYINVNDFYMILCCAYFLLCSQF